MTNKDDLNSLVSGLKRNGIPNVGELEEVNAYLEKNGLTSDKEKLDYLRRIDPASIDNSLQKLGVTSTNLAIVTEEFEKFLELTQKPLKSLQETFQSITSIQNSFANINKILQNSPAIQSGLSKAVQNLVIPKLAPDLGGLLSRMVTSQIDWSEMTVPVIGLDWTKMTYVIDGDTVRGLPDLSRIISRVFEDVSEKPVIAITEDTELKGAKLELYGEKLELAKDAAKNAELILDVTQKSSEVQQNSEVLQKKVEALPKNSEVSDAQILQQILQQNSEFYAAQTSSTNEMLLFTFLMLCIMIYQLIYH